MSKDLKDWLMKRDAAQLLGVAEKTIERLATRGEIQKATRKRPGAASVVVYHPADVERVRQEQAAAAKPSAFPMAPTSEAATNDRAQLQDKFLAAFEALLSRQAQQPLLLSGAADRTEPSLTDLSVKLILRLSEAQRLTGIPRSILLEAIKAGKLKADDGRWGRGWRMKRSDLDSYIAESK